jgi:esterase/lipase superfamily enzyme
MTGEQASKVIASEWERISKALGLQLEEFESKLLPLLRVLEQDPLDAKAVTEVLDLIDVYPAVRDIVRPALDRAAGPAKGSEFPLLQVRSRCTRVPVFFGTSRLANLADIPGYFGADRGGGNSYGIAEVSIPDDHRMGKLEKPRWWRLEFWSDPERHVTVLDAQVINLPDFTDQARTAVNAAEQKQVLVFVHGFNVTFENALRRAAQLVYDLHFPGVAALYSWPSEGSIPDYMIDANNVTWAEPYFEEFLRILRDEIGAETVHIISHSMGSRLVSNTVARWSGPAPAGQVVFAAPDIDAQVFQHLAATFGGKADRFTLYASSEDLALKASKKLQKYSRAGESGLGLVIVPDVDSIDASSVKTDFLNHSYFGDADSVLGDLFYLIRNGFAPDARARLRKRDLYGKTYWFLTP